MVPPHCAKGEEGDFAPTYAAPYITFFSHLDQLRTSPVILSTQKIAVLAAQRCMRQEHDCRAKFQTGEFRIGWVLLPSQVYPRQNSTSCLPCTNQSEELSL